MKSVNIFWLGIILSIFVVFFLVLYLGQKDNKLTSLCGFDFSKMVWNSFNEDKIIEHYGIGCGYEADAPARKHVFYDDKSGLWFQFNIIESFYYCISKSIRIILFH